MKTDCDTTAAFTGHRTYDGRCDHLLEQAVRRLHAAGYRTFMTGMAAGFDLAAGECVLRLRDELTGLRLHCAVPFDGHCRSLGAADRARYERLTAEADEVTVLAPRYFPRVYHLRNDFLVDRSSAVIAYFDGTPGGTKYTLRRALQAGSEVENLWQGLFCR